VYFPYADRTISSGRQIAVLRHFPVIEIDCPALCRKQPAGTIQAWLYDWSPGLLREVGNIAGTVSPQNWGKIPNFWGSFLESDYLPAM